MTSITRPVDNGVNTEALAQARDVLREDPEAAEFTWRTSCSWVHGTYSRSISEGFSGLGQEHLHRNLFGFDTDHPECFAVRRPGATPSSTSSPRWPDA